MAIVEARKREEEELHREAERALAKRKKFKEVRRRGWNLCMRVCTYARSASTGRVVSL
jgi:hypothetical protein